MSPARFLRQMTVHGMHTRKNTISSPEEQSALQSQGVGGATNATATPSSSAIGLGAAPGASAAAPAVSATGGPAATVAIGGTTYQASSRAAAANNTNRVAAVAAEASLNAASSASVAAATDSSGVIPAPAASSMLSPEKARAQALAAVSRVKARLLAQQRALSLMSPGSSQRHSLFVSEANWAHTLHSGDLDKLSASLASSVAHDAMVLREMMPSFQSMFTAVVAVAAERQQNNALGSPRASAAANMAASRSPPECVTMEDVRALLEKKLLLPLPSCQSIMQVLSLALQSCLTAAESAASTSSAAVTGGGGTANASTSAAAGGAGGAAGAAPSSETPLPPSAFSGPLSSSAFAAVLSKALHLQSSPFSHFLSPALNFAAAARSVCAQVFLGGSCNPTTWRVDEAIPCLSAAGISHFNPQVDNWSQELVLIESLIKCNCDTLLFVIDSDTRAIASMIEAAEYICQGRDVVLVVKQISSDDPSNPARVNGEPLGPAQVRDLNRARSYVTDVAQRHGLDVFTDIGLACEYIVSKIRSAQSLAEQHAREVESFISSDEFVEKTFEEFFRCDTHHSGVLDATQLLLACLHLEQDLRPLLPPQAANKHRQPQMSDVELILAKFGTPSSASSPSSSSPGIPAPAINLNPEQFLHFSRVLFRNVCAHVKL
jgi:hypothetical protein